MKIEKSMIDRFQREREGKMPIALIRGQGSWRRIEDSISAAREFAFDLRKTCHGADRHK